MSESQQRTFYGDDGRAFLYEVIANLRTLVGSDSCAIELIEASDYVEWVCGPGAALMEMPHWIN